MCEEPHVLFDAPPMFLAVSTDHEGAELIAGTFIKYYEPWRHAGRSVELHAYAAGGHGFGMNRQGPPIDPMGRPVLRVAPPRAPRTKRSSSGDGSAARCPPGPSSDD